MEAHTAPIELVLLDISQYLDDARGGLFAVRVDELSVISRAHREEGFCGEAEEKLQGLYCAFPTFQLPSNNIGYKPLQI